MSSQQISNSRQAAWVGIGSLFSFVVGIISPMILSRYFDKGDYGTYKQVMYVYNTLLTIFTLGLPRAYAYFLPKYTEEYSRDIINKVTRIFFVLGAVFSIFLLLFAGPISSIMKNPDLKTALIAFSPTPFLLLPTMGLDAIYASFRKTRYLAYYTIATKVLTIMCIVLPVMIFSGNYLYAIIGFDIASAITFILALYLKTWPIRHKEHKKVKLTYREIFAFSLPLLYASLWGIIIASSNQFFISRYFGNEVFAEFSNGFMELPFVAMVIGSISTVLLPLFAGMDKGEGMSKEVFGIWNSALIKSAKLIFPMLVFSIFFSSTLMRCMYGDLYIGSSVYFAIKNISGLFCILPFYPIILAIGKTKDYANVHMIIAFIIVALEWTICEMMSSAVYVAIASEVCQILKIGLLMKVIANYANKSVLQLVHPKMLLRLLMLSGFASILPAILLSYITLNKFVALFLGLIIFLICYYILCKLFGVTYKDTFAGLFGNTGISKKIIRYLP